ncbi:unnamed protein product [Allacma fusca]|uniref:Ion transport domain-containing protein n=1 Tax=Allacma fusca TaxID=39272 RepID=A0A8J2JP31_9HEXA|nr:unnamed protein product [Allacma fusca]
MENHHEKHHEKHHAKHHAKHHEENHEGKSEFLSRLSSIPLVHVTILFTADMYARAKSSLWILGKTSSLIENVIQQAMIVSQPLMNMVLPMAAAPLSKADKLATKGLETLERNMPVITKEPQEIVSDTKELISSRVNPAVERLNVVSENVLSSRFAQLSFDCVEKVLEQSNRIANSVLPKDQANGDASGFPREPEPEQKSARGSWLVRESFHLIYSTTQRVFGIAQSRADSMRRGSSRAQKLEVGSDQKLSGPKAQISTSSRLEAKTSGRFKVSRKHTNPLTYEQAFKPHEIAHIKFWNSMNTSNIPEFGLRKGQTLTEDVFIRRFLTCTWHNLFVSEILIKRQANLIRIAGIIQQSIPARKMYFLLGYSEEILSHWIQCPVKLELQTVEDKKSKRTSSDDDVLKLKPQVSLDGDHGLCLLKESPLRILRVAECGNVKELKRILNRDPTRLHAHDSKGRRAVHQAALKNHVGVLEVIVENDGDLNVQDIEGNTPLHAAGDEEALNAIDFLLRNGSDAQKQNTKSYSVLHIAAERNKIQSLLTLSKHLSLLDVDQSGPLGRTPLHLACINDCFECVRILLEDLHCSSRRACLQSSLPIHEAAKHGSSKSLEVLLQWNGPVVSDELINVPDAEGNQALHLAIHGGDMNTIRICLEAGAKISSPQKDMCNAVHLASAQGSLEMVKLMFEIQPGEKDYSLNACDVELMSPLHYASMFDHKEIVEYLVSQGADLSLVEKNGWTPLHLAATRNAWQSVKILMKLTGEIQLQDKNGHTVLHLIVKFCGDLHRIMDDETLPQFLLILETQDKRGNTAMHIAAKNGQIKSLAKLLKLGCSITTKNNYGENVFHVACRHKQTEIILHLTEHPHFNSVINESNGSGCTPFHIAASEGHDKILEMLMKKGAFLHRDHEGRTPLHLAAGNGHLNVVKLILNTQAHLIDIKDKVGNTALHLAAEQNRPKVTDLLLGLNCQLAFNKDGYSAIDLALVNKHVEVTYVMVTHAKRGEQLLGLTLGKHPCIMVSLIEKMPGVAKAVLEKSVKKSTNEKCDSLNYKVEYDFKWLTKSQADHNGSQKYLPILNEMVKYGRVNLLSHDLSKKYLDMKWNAYGKYFQFLNLFLYLIYLSLLTIVATSYYNKDRGFFIRWKWLNFPPNKTIGGNISAVENENNFFNGFHYNDAEYEDGKRKYGHTDTAWKTLIKIEEIVTYATIINLLVEVGSIIRHGLKHCQDVATWVWLLMNITSFLTSGVYTFIFVFGYTEESIPIPIALFNPGMAITSFMAWFYLFLIMERFDSVGLYVSMFLEILKTMMRVLIIFSILIVAFSAAFFIMLSSGNHIVFSDFPISVIRTFSMMLGDLDFMSTFLYPYHCAEMEMQNKTDARIYTMINECRNYPRRISHPYATFPMVCLYMIFMPIVMINLLIGLAVGDIESVRKNAQLKRLSMQVQSHTNLEKLIPNCLLQKIESSSAVEYPNVIKPINWVNHVVMFFQTSSTQKDDSEDVNLKNDDLTETLEDLATDIETVKGMVQLYCPMIQLLCQRMKINLDDHSEGLPEESPAQPQPRRKSFRRGSALSPPTIVHSETFESAF